jgi:hypothetical protein
MRQETSIWSLRRRQFTHAKGVFNDNAARGVFLEHATTWRGDDLRELPDVAESGILS